MSLGYVINYNETICGSVFCNNPIEVNINPSTSKLCNKCIKQAKMYMKEFEKAGKQLTR